MARAQHTPPLVHLEEAITVLFCLVDDAYKLLNPKCPSHESLKRLSDSEVLTGSLAAASWRGERTLLPARRPTVLRPPLPRGCEDAPPSSLHRRVRRLRRFLEPLRRAVVGELVGDPETVIVDSTLLSVLHPRQVKQSAACFEGAAWVKWGSFAVYGVKLHLLCATNRVPLSYELTAANVADVLVVRELLAEAGLEEGTVARRLLGDLAYRGGELGEELARHHVLLAAERADRRPSVRQQVEVCFAALKVVFGAGETLAKTLVGLVTRIAAKVAAYTYGMYVNRLFGRPQGRIKELWA